MENRLRELRKKRRLTQVGLQMQTGIEQTLISKYERGERPLPLELADRLADYYHTSVDYLLGRTEVRAPYPKKKP